VGVALGGLGISLYSRRGEQSTIQGSPGNEISQQTQAPSTQSELNNEMMSGVEIRDNSAAIEIFGAPDQVQGFYKNFLPGDQFGTTGMLGNAIEGYPRTTLIGEPGVLGASNHEDAAKNPTSASYTPENRERVNITGVEIREAIDEGGTFVLVDGSGGRVNLYDAGGNKRYVLGFTTAEDTTLFLLIRTPEKQDTRTPNDLSWQIGLERIDPRDSLNYHIMRTFIQEPQQRFSADYMRAQIETAIGQECGDAGCNKAVVVELDLTTGAFQVTKISRGNQGNLIAQSLSSNI
jgi:hypothetical protein